jgi:hypothetical protein
MVDIERLGGECLRLRRRRNASREVLCVVYRVSCVVWAVADS